MLAEYSCLMGDEGLANDMCICTAACTKTSLTIKPFSRPQPGHPMISEKLGCRYAAVSECRSAGLSECVRCASCAPERPCPAPSRHPMQPACDIANGDSTHLDHLAESSSWCLESTIVSCTVPC